MESAEQPFKINNKGSNKSRPNILTRTVQEEIPVGNEGKITRETVSSPRGDHGRYIFKQIYSEDQGQEQMQKWQYFNRHGVRVPELFKPVILEDGTHSIVITDLSNNGRYQVLSTNNPEVKTDDFRTLALKISPTSKERIRTDMIYACEVAAGQHNSDGENPDGILYALQSNAFMTAINPDNPDDINVYVADFGDDVTRKEKQKHDPSSILESNLRSAAIFYTWMTSEPFQLPNEHPLAQTLNPDLTTTYSEILSRSGWTNYKPTHT